MNLPTKSRMISVLASLVVLLAPAIVRSENLQAYPEAEVVDSQVDNSKIHRNIILGALQKINNVLRPRAIERVLGSQSSITYYLPGVRDVKPVIDFYRSQLQQHSQILFECSGRACGSSEYWANTVFAKSILYGPEKYQSYQVARVDNSSEIISVYIGQRGTKKVYVHVLSTKLDEKPNASLSNELSAALLSHGQYIMPPSVAGKFAPALVDATVSFLTAQQNRELIVVGHVRRGAQESMDEALQRSKKFAGDFKAALLAAGANAEQIEFYGVGPLAPSEGQPSRRLELLVLPE